jgi:hypothetical protein
MLTEAEIVIGAANRMSGQSVPKTTVPPEATADLSADSVHLLIVVVRNCAIGGADGITQPPIRRLITVGMIRYMRQF